MIEVPLKEYIVNKNKYSDIDPRYISVHLKTKDMNGIAFSIREFPEKPFVVDNKEYVVPKYIMSHDTKMHFIYQYPNSFVENYVVRIDDILASLEKSQGDKIKLNKNQYINMDDYVLSEKQHWFNREVIRFYKTIQEKSVLFASDLPKAKKIFKQLCEPNGKPIDYQRKLLVLFKLTGVSDEAFRKFIFKEGE